MYKLISDINALLNEEEVAQGSFSVVAPTQKSNELFERYAHFKEYPTKRDDNGNPTREVLYHITISYRPPMSVAKGLQKYLGQKVKVKMSGIYSNDFIQAFYVKEMTWENGEKLEKRDAGQGKTGPAHMTISWDRGHKPAEANDMLEQREKSNPRPDPGSGVTEEFTGEFVFIPSKPKA